MQKLIIDVDLDATAADFFGPLLARYNDQAGENVVQEDIKSWDMASHVGDPGLLKSIFHAPGFFGRLQPLPGAVLGIKTLVNDGHEVHIVTSGCTPHAYSEKALWCATHLPFIHLDNVNISHRKGRYRGDILIDDGAHNAQAYGLSNAGSLRIGIEHPHNRSQAGVFTHLLPSYVDPAGAWMQIVEVVRGRAQ